MQNLIKLSEILCQEIFAKFFEVAQPGAAKRK